jgi:hypothetical protein
VGSVTPLRLLFSIFIIISCSATAQQNSPTASADSGSLNGQESIHGKRQGKTVELALPALKNKSEADVLRQLTSFNLTERMSTQQLKLWKAAMPGEQTFEALTALADASVFLSLPADELPKLPPLDSASQQQLLTRMNRYVDETMAKLPNFFAVQNVTTFEAIQGLRNSAHVIIRQPMHYVGLVSTKIRYQNGREVMERDKGEVNESDQIGYKLLFSGQFGPVLNTVVTDAERNKLSWSHWEPGSPKESVLSSPIAVFRYSVPRKASHSRIKVVMPGNTFSLEAQPGYHGEIFVDPASGTILRLTLISDLTADDPMSAANLMVEYGPVELGGEIYICPIRSVTIETVNEADSNRQGVVTSTSSPDYGPTHDTGMTYLSKGDVPSETLLNDVVFDQYQILRTDFHIIFNPDNDKVQN